MRSKSWGVFNCMSRGGGAGVAEAIQHWSGLGVAIIFFLNR